MRTVREMLMELTHLAQVPGAVYWVTQEEIEALLGATAFDDAWHRQGVMNGIRTGTARLLGVRILVKPTPADHKQTTDKPVDFVLTQGPDGVWSI